MPAMATSVNIVVDGIPLRNCQLIMFCHSPVEGKTAGRIWCVRVCGAMREKEIGRHRRLVCNWCVPLGGPRHVLTDRSDFVAVSMKHGRSSSMKHIGQTNCAIEIVFRLMMSGWQLPDAMPLWNACSPRDLYRRGINPAPLHGRSRLSSHGGRR